MSVSDDLIDTYEEHGFVIPIKEEYRSQVKGFVHDVSNAGSTLFIEPISIFELNNEINQLRLEEEVEIEKILQQLTSLFYPYIEDLKTDMEVIGTLDFIFAKAKYAKKLNGTIPNISSWIDRIFAAVPKPLYFNATKKTAGHCFAPAVFFCSVMPAQLSTLHCGTIPPNFPLSLCPRHKDHQSRT